MLDKDKIQQALYFTIASIIESSEAESEVRIHFSRRSETINIAVWVSHPWLGDGLPQVKLPALPTVNGADAVDETFSAVGQSCVNDRQLGDRVLIASVLEAAVYRVQEVQEGDRNASDDNPHKLLGLILGCHLAESHGGKIAIQGSPELGYRYVLMLPKIAAQENELENS